MKHKSPLIIMLIAACLPLLGSCDDISGKYVNTVLDDQGKPIVVTSIELFLNNKCDYIVERKSEGTSVKAPTCSWQRYSQYPYQNQIHIITPNVQKPGHIHTFYGVYEKGDIVERDTQNYYYKQ